MCIEKIIAFIQIQCETVKNWKYERLNDNRGSHENSNKFNLMAWSLPRSIIELVTYVSYKYVVLHSHAIAGFFVLF